MGPLKRLRTSLFRKHKSLLVFPPPGNSALAPVPLLILKERFSWNRWIADLFLQFHNRFVQTKFNEEEGPCVQEIANFKRVSPYFYCGSQPTSEGFTWLLQHGITKVITLREENLLTPKILTLNGIKHLALPIKDRSVPTFAQVEQFLKEVDGSLHEKVFLHCRGGTGRTKMLVACWQVAHGYPAEQAIREALTAGIRFSKEFAINVSLSIVFSMNSRQQAFVRAFETYWKQNQTINLIA